MKKLSLLFIAATAFLTANAQSAGAVKPLKKTISFTMPRTVDDDMPGTRGACVAWHPVQKKYYASMAGNIGYPMGVFDATGKLLSSDTLSTNADTRGLWYNTVKKELQGNAYADNGWFRYAINANGIPVKTTVLLEGQNQPDAHSVGAFNPLKQQVLFLYNGQVYFYSLEGVEAGKPLKIHWGLKKGEAAPEEDEDEEIMTPESYNYTSVVYTGIKGAELGFLNTESRGIELYNIADGFLSKKLFLPDDVTAVYPNFNFAFANGMYWLFNMEERTWTGYK